MSDKVATANARLFFVDYSGGKKKVEMISNNFIKTDSTFFLNSISLKSKVLADATNTKINTNFGALSKEIASGSFEFRIENKLIPLKKDEIGYFKLNKRKLISTKTKISFIIKTNTLIKNNTLILLELIGTERLNY